MGQPSGVPTVNVLAVVLIAVLAAAALPVLGELVTGVVLSLGFVAFGVYLVLRGQRAIGALFVLGAAGIVAALFLRN